MSTTLRLTLENFLGQLGVEFRAFVAGVDGADRVLAATEQVGLQVGFGLFCDGLEDAQRLLAWELPMTMVSGASSGAVLSCTLQYLASAGSEGAKLPTQGSLSPSNWVLTSPAGGDGVRQ